MFEAPDPDADPTMLYVYASGSRYYPGRAIGLRGTNNSRFQRSGGSAQTWLRLIRGDTVNLKGHRHA